MNRPARRYICIHGHFYQPPRENPWLEAVERQRSAFPFHDWNERILAECYRPNGAARIIDGSGRIVHIVDNYERISFNFGPTLMSWMADHAADVHQAIIDADERSRERFSGHGCALAQVYNHIIMPLANRRDKVTQVGWGVRDFEHRFGRAPDGMWLAETAVDTETLDIMAQAGIRFTILAPGQALRVRAIDESGAPVGPWRDVGDGSIESGRAYRANLPSGRHIDLFFYHGANSSAVAFGRLLDDGALFARQLVDATRADEPWLSHIATDGETYGHHHRYGEMALAYALDRIDGTADVTLTNYSEFLSLRPARHEVEIRENSAWSCAHGVGRWSDDCGCRMQDRPGWNQRWRKGLRQTLDGLRDQLADIFEHLGRPLFADPWSVRDQYIEVILDRDPAHVARFLDTHAGRQLDRDEQCQALQLLEMQRHTLLMYTSCGWFFDDFTGPEGTQILRYAARAIELGELLSGHAIEAPFLERLQDIRSNQPEYRDGRHAYERLVRPAEVDLGRVVAHYTISSLFESHDRHERLHCYDIQVEGLVAENAGKAKLAMGTARCTSTITWASSRFTFAVVHMGEHNLAGGFRPAIDIDRYQAMVADVHEAFARADLIEAQRRLDRHFGEHRFSLDSLFPDHRERILERILDGPLAEAEAAYNQIYGHHAPLMRYLSGLDLPIPDAFFTAARFILRLRLRRELERERPDMTEIQSLIREAKLVGVDLADQAMEHLARQSLERLAHALGRAPQDVELLRTMAALAESIQEEHWHVDLWNTQNQCYQLRARSLRDAARAIRRTSPDQPTWDMLMDRLCRAVGLAVAAPATGAP